MTKYTLPSGLASCEMAHPLGEIEWTLPSKASRRNEALREALQELAELQQGDEEFLRNIEEEIDYVCDGYYAPLVPKIIARISAKLKEKNTRIKEAKKCPT